MRYPCFCTFFPNLTVLFVAVCMGHLGPRIPHFDYFHIRNIASSFLSFNMLKCSNIELIVATCRHIGSLLLKVLYRLYRYLTWILDQILRCLMRHRLILSVLVLPILRIFLPECLILPIQCPVLLIAGTTYHQPILIPALRF